MRPLHLLSRTRRQPGRRCFSVSLSLIAPLSVHAIDAFSSPSPVPPSTHIMSVIPLPLLVLQVVTGWRSSDWPYFAIVGAMVITSEPGFGVSPPMVHTLDASCFAFTPQVTDDTMDVDDADPMDTEED